MVDDSSVGSVVYLDTSALVKLVVREPESEALEHELRGWTDAACSALAWVELPRAVRRRLGKDGPSLIELWAALAASAEVPVSDEVIGIAARLDPPRLGSLDAIHLASALSLGDAVGALITYDVVLERAARTRACLRFGPFVATPWSCGLTVGPASHSPGFRVATSGVSASMEWAPSAWPALRLRLRQT